MQETEAAVLGAATVLLTGLAFILAAQLPIY